MCSWAYNKTTSLWQRFGKIFPPKNFFLKKFQICFRKNILFFFLTFFSQKPIFHDLKYFFGIVFIFIFTREENSPKKTGKKKNLKVGYFFSQELGQKVPFCPFWHREASFYSILTLIPYIFRILLEVFEKVLKKVAPTSLCLFPGYLAPQHIFSSKCFWETDKMKLDNFIFKYSENFQ